MDSEKIITAILYQTAAEKQEARRESIADTITANEKYQCYTVDQIVQKSHCFRILTVK